MTDQDLIELYLEQGYLMIPRLINEDFLAIWKAQFENLVLDKVPLRDGMILMEDVEVAKGTVVPISRLHGMNKLLNFEDDPVLWQYVVHPKIVEVVQKLIGTGLYSLVTNVFNKPPYVDGRHPLHQDLRYFRMRPADKIVAVWTAISPCTRESGCLAVVPGTHKAGALEHELPDWEYVNFGFYGIKGSSGFQRTYLTMEPGDTVFFHPLLVHGSGRNSTADFRQSISAHYASHSCISPEPDWRANHRVRQVQTS